ncbi:MAG: hypothetical protein MJY82_10215 [Fibrobacter sp.]|nr:hypothetical protein [Fibrobacter sp.]
MKKRFALYGMFAAMAIFAAACGDDSSSSASAPEDEEYSSSIDDEESSSSEKAVSSSSAKKDGKSSSSEAKKGKSSSSEKSDKSSSSEAKKDDKSSSSEKATSSSSAKDDKSSSSEKPSSSSSEPESSSSEPESSSSSEPESSSSEPESSSSSIPYGVTCSAKRDGNVVSAEMLVKTIDDKVKILKVQYDYDNMKSRQSLPFSNMNVKSCDEARGIGAFTVIECSDETRMVEIEMNLTSEDLYPEIATPADAEKNFCSEFESGYDVYTSSLNKKMLDNGEYGEFRDFRDAKLYRTIQIGDQTWMAQNLNYESESGSSCYGGETYKCYQYGRLYTWEAAQNACPDGWRLPTTTEWDNLLVKTMGAESIFNQEDGTTTYLGEKMSLLGGEGRANEYGLSIARGGSYGSFDDEDPSYIAMGENGTYWLAGEEGNGSAVMVYEDNYSIMLDNLAKGNMQLYVRCVKDAK